MNKRTAISLLLAICSLGAKLIADDLPRLPKELSAIEQDYQAQKKLPELRAAYVSTSPQNLGDGLQVGTLDLPGTKEALDPLAKHKEHFSVLSNLTNIHGSRRGTHWGATSFLTSVDIGRTPGSRVPNRMQHWISR